MSDLRTDFVDDILATSENGTRKFNIVDANGDVLYEGIHLEDVTNYLQVGDEYGADEINEQNTAINQINSDLSELTSDIANNFSYIAGTTISDGGTTSLTFNANTKLICIAAGVRGTYNGLPFLVFKSMLSKVAGSKILVTGNSEGNVKFELTTTGITLSSVKNSTDIINVFEFG